ncbi:MAG: anhydro-N-acetylmuramic acid kinase [Gemmatimonadaceae bacterium]
MSGTVVVGLMSGTSCDGITAAAVRFTGAANVPRAELLAWRTTPYDAAQRDRLFAAMAGATPRDYARLDYDLGEWLAGAALGAIAQAKLVARDVSAIASHGHTIWHEPGHSTWQIGQAAVIAERTGLAVVSDFRARDVAAGGQGAPLVPIADQLLFAGSEWRALQNLGGIANVTLVPPRGDGDVLAFDTGPGVAVIDGVTRALAPPLRFDAEGALATRGRANDDVVRALMAEPYFSAPPPKSTGRELFGAGYVTRLIEACGGAAIENVVATAVALTARSIADAYSRWLPHAPADVLLSGGGAKNPALVRAITDALAPRVVRRFEERFFDGEAKEAVAFALLGWLHLENVAGNTPATGARGARVLGAFTPGRGPDG